MFKTKERELSKDELIQAMGEPRPLPLGMKEFEEWSDRIISGACIPGASERSQKGLLAFLLNGIGNTDDHLPDGYFIKAMRVNCTKQIAGEYIMMLKAAKDKEAQEQQPTQ